MKPSEGKGRGIFAVQDILKGTHVLVETPLLVVSPPALVPGMGYSLSAMAADVEHEYSRLSLEQQKEYLSCHEQRLEGDSQDESGRLMAILRSNAYNLDDGRVAIYPKVALINHSCQPNVLNADNGGTRVIVATRDIQEGEEVCSSRHQLVDNHTADPTSGVKAADSIPTRRSLQHTSHCFWTRKAATRGCARTDSVATAQPAGLESRTQDVFRLVRTSGSWRARSRLPAKRPNLQETSSCRLPKPWQSTLKTRDSPITTSRQAGLPSTTPPWPKIRAMPGNGDRDT